MKRLLWFLMFHLHWVSLQRTHAYRMPLKHQSLLRRMPQYDASNNIEYLVFGGGGAKGFGNPGVYQALYDASMMDDVKAVSGSSVGALTAALIAVGIEPGDIRQAILETDIHSLINFMSFDGPNVIPGITKSLEPMEFFINQLMLESTYRFLKKQQNPTPAQRAIMHKMMYEEYALSFRDLDLLHQDFPKKFKKLYIPAVVLGTGDIEVFDHRHDVSIAKASIASAAMPIKFSPVKINTTYYLDAGLVNPLPTDFFMNEHARSKTLLFLFDNPVWREVVEHHTCFAWLDAQGEMNFMDAYYVPLINFFMRGINVIVFLAKVMHFLCHFIIQSNEVDRLLTDLQDIHVLLLSKPFDFSQKFVANIIFERLRDDFNNQTVLLDSGSLKITNFALAKNCSETLQSMYYLDTMAFLLKNKKYKGSVFQNEHDLYAVFEEGVSSSANASYGLIKKAVQDDIHAPEAKSLTLGTKKIMDWHRAYGFFNASSEQRDASSNKTLLFNHHR